MNKGPLGESNIIRHVMSTNVTKSTRDCVCNAGSSHIFGVGVNIKFQIKNGKKLPEMVELLKMLDFFKIFAIISPQSRKGIVFL